jgi:hypothetical protein
MPPWKELVNPVSYSERIGKLTVLPSGLFCLPPIPDLTYGVLDVGCKHLSLSASMRLHVCCHQYPNPSNPHPNDSLSGIAHIRNLIGRCLLLKLKHHNMNNSHLRTAERRSRRAGTAERGTEEAKQGKENNYCNDGKAVF